ncbi:hypothetical protein EVAR_98485_1 [Eumeta japonica]|uniref:Uncharacterized protein n=1 Tax=Eumeta variegata TaxID=151549 RepID=A0A4C1YEZ7_EUMVA|nr:hypothetical protein EVAR_98485_1 [Eumeta japonica]
MYPLFKNSLLIITSSKKEDLMWKVFTFSDIGHRARPFFESQLDYNHREIRGRDNRPAAVRVARGSFSSPSRPASPSDRIYAAYTTRASPVRRQASGPEASGQQMPPGPNIFFLLVLTSLNLNFFSEVTIVAAPLLWRLRGCSPGCPPSKSGCGWESLMKNVTLGNVTMSHRTRERPAECLASLSHSTMIGLPRAQH